jgi:hypothetical protein
VPPEGLEVSGCGHPVEAIDVIDDAAICTVCGTNVDHPANSPAIVDEVPQGGGLRHITWNPDQPYASRPYTPVEVEMEIVATVDLIDRGTTWLVGADEARYQAKMAFDLERARKLLVAPGRSAEQRDAWATVETEELYREWQRLEIIHRTRERAMHNLRAKLSGLQSVSKSISMSLNMGGGR